MPATSLLFPSEDLLKAGLRNRGLIHYQLSPEELASEVLKRKEGELSDTGALVIQTGEFTGRSPKDKFIVQDDSTRETVNWNEFNIPISSENFALIYKKAMTYLNRQPALWVRDAFACASPEYRLSIRVINERPADNLFACNMFLQPNAFELEDFIAGWYIICAPGLRLEPNDCGTRQQNASVISFKHKTVIIAGTGYTGEMKKGIFTVLNYILPRKKNVLSMHCSANMGSGDDTAIFFGLSGTGKTTLSADPSRKLIGDDEHGWTENGIFNFEGGCYAKVINLSPENEPEIFNAIRPGALLENVVFYPGTKRVNFSDASITENTRVSYPLRYIRNAAEPSIGNIPKNIFFLTCDAFGVMPPVSKLSPSQAMYQFISGYTAKVAGTETGITEPKPTFSACFGAPFIPLHPGTYAQMLGNKLKEYNVNVWLINTGWSGGSVGKGSRIKLCYTRAMIAAALKGTLNAASFETDPVFGFAMPVQCPGVPAELLNPRNTWADTSEYDDKAKFLAGLFRNNFKRFEQSVSEEVRGAGPMF